MIHQQRSHTFVAAAEQVRAALNELSRIWETTTSDAVDVDDTLGWHNKLHEGLAEKYPLGRDLDDLVAEMDVWIEDVTGLLEQAPVQVAIDLPAGVTSVKQVTFGEDSTDQILLRGDRKTVRAALVKALADTDD